MKVLHFQAVAPHPKVAPPLLSQSARVLRPFNRYLGQAIHTAKQRQTRYQLPWERVRSLRSVALEPTDTLLRVPRGGPGVRLADWPANQEWSLDEPAFVPERGLVVSVTAAVPTAAGLRVQTSPPVLPTDTLIWCRMSSRVVPETEPAPPRTVQDPTGRPLALVEPATASDDGEHWLLRVEGVHRDCDLLVEGELLEAEALPAARGLRRLVDTQGRSFELSGGVLRVEELPAEGLLRGDDGGRYRWREQGADGRRGCWVQLLPPETAEADDFMDPRAAFCEGDVSEVWTQPRRRAEATHRVIRVDPDRYQLLLDRYPPAGSTLFLPVDLRNLHLQRRALRQLSEAPLPHHQGLLRLCEDPRQCRWPDVAPVSVEHWYSLVDASRSGTSEQRAFVEKALGSRDFAFLEGPPGSGKTTAICELVQQLVARGQRVLLCSSTHVAIDNVLERLLASDSPIDAVRIGRVERVDDKVRSTQLDERVASLVHRWRLVPALACQGDGELHEMAERTVVMSANLTCGTTMGIVNHPLFRGRDAELHVSERPITTLAYWDVLIVDEASKTLIQEFMVPALMARRWIVVGDVRQLPPFADRAEIVANLRDLVDERDQPVFPADHQRACLLLYRLLRPQVRQPGMRWLLVERPGVLEWVARELAADPPPELFAVRVATRAASASGPIPTVTVAQLQEGAPESLLLAAADWVLVGDDLLGTVAERLPSNLLLARDVTAPGAPLAEHSALLTRQAWWLDRADPLPRPYTDRGQRGSEVRRAKDAQDCESDWLQRHDHAQEIAWRLTRLHELRRSRNDRELQRLRRQLGQLLPAAVDIESAVAEIEDIGLPSILEVLQEGIGEERSSRPSALTAGLRTTRPEDFAARFESLKHQHRMHPEIAAFPREVVYAGEALLDANTIESRDRVLGWSFGGFRSRRAWADLAGREQGGVNLDEVHAMAGLLLDFIAWARHKGPPPGRESGVWEAACLSFYAKQDRAVSDMLRQLSRSDGRTRFEVKDAPVELVCGTVDRFQGREADLVLLSMRNTRRVGFLDSPNRLNVAVSRARQQLVVFGNARYFGGCGVSELEELVRRTPLVEDAQLRRWRRGNR